MRLKPIALLLLLLTLGAWAQIDPVREVNDSAARIQAQISRGLQLEWQGRGLFSGNIFNLKMTNNTGEDMTVNLATGQVIEPGDPGTQKMILEGTGDVVIPAGKSVTLLVRGYCLESNKQPPSARSGGFKVAGDASPYRQAVMTVREGMRLARAGMYGTELQLDKQRTIVIQRALWAQEPNPSTRDNLYKELEAELTNSESAQTGHSPNLPVLTDGLWRDVTLTLAEVRKNP